MKVLRVTWSSDSVITRITLSCAGSTVTLALPSPSALTSAMIAGVL